MIELELLSQRPFEAIELESPRALADIPTPALLLDEDLLDANIERMAAHLARHGKQARPHAKTHKCPLISRRQITAGAVGVCVAKLSEAFIQARGGVQDILVTSPITTADRIPVIVRTLLLAPELKLAVDSRMALDLAATAATSAAELGGQALGIVLDIDIEMGRTGNRSAAALCELAEQVVEHPQLRLAGIQHYAGHLQHIEDGNKRQQKSLASWEQALEIGSVIEDAGFTLDIVTGGGTGTFDIDSQVDRLTDLQVGSYIFMDAEYRTLGGIDGAASLPFETALTIQASVISQPAAGRVTIDSGYKSMASETVSPELLDVPGGRFKFFGDEQGMVILGEGSQEPLLGRKLRMVSPHCDPTVNLYDYYWVHRDGFAHSLWPISGRGCAW